MMPDMEKLMLVALMTATIVVLSTAFGLIAAFPVADAPPIIW